MASAAGANLFISRILRRAAAGITRDDRLHTENPSKTASVHQKQPPPNTALAILPLDIFPQFLVDRALRINHKSILYRQQRNLDPDENIDLRKDEVQARSEPLVDPVAHIVVKIYGPIGVLARASIRKAPQRRLSMLQHLQTPR